MNDSVEFGKTYPEIYPTEIESKVERNGSHATFLDLDISIYKGKLNGTSLTFILLECHKLQVTYHLSFFYSSTISEFLRISRSTLLLKDFLPVAKNLLDRMINQVGSKHLPLQQIKKACNSHLKAFYKNHIMASDIVSKIAAT